MSSQISFWLLFVIPIFFGLHTSKSVHGECLKEQQSLLLAFKSELIYKSFSLLAGWNTSVECCYWDGVTCDKGGHVVGLDLSNNSISGAINESSSVFGFRFLQSLNLAYNYFDPGPLLSGFGKLMQVRYLNLSNANFEGQIPIEFSLLTSLVTLDLSSPYTFTRSLENPDLRMLIQNLTELKELHLDNVEITMTQWFDVISSLLPNLRVLSLKSCSLSGPLDSSVSSLAKLKYLSVILLDENMFSSQVPESFADFQNLTVLSLSGCNLSGSIPKRIFQVPTLKTIDLSSNVILEGPLPEFHKNGSLENLILTGTQVGGTLPDSIGNLVMLSRVELRRCGFSGPIPDSMQNLTRIEHLDLSGSSFIGSIPSFQSSKNLVSADLQQNNLTGIIPSSYWEGLNKLEYLNLASNSLSGNFPESVLTLPLLQYLHLSNNSFSGQIISKATNVSCYQLNTIDLSSNRFEGSIPEFIFTLPLLSTLILSANNFTGFVELSMFGKLKELYALELSYNDFTVTVNTDTSSFSSLFKLDSLSLASCKMIQIPDLKNQSRLMMLDLSVNELSGEIPNWIWEVGNGYLRSLNLSHNKLSSFQKPYTFPSRLDILDLHSNILQGDIPIPSKGSYILD